MSQYLELYIYIQVLSVNIYQTQQQNRRNEEQSAVDY